MSARLALLGAAALFVAGCSDRQINDPGKTPEAASPRPGTLIPIHIDAARGLVSVLPSPSAARADSGIALALAGPMHLP